MTIKRNIATDADEVLVMMSGKWMKKIIQHPSTKAFITSKEWKYVLNNHPLNRNFFDILTIFDESYHVISTRYRQDMMELYFLDETFYDDLNPSFYMKSLLTMAKHQVLQDVYVVSSCIDLSHPVTKSKFKFLEKNFHEIRQAGVTVRYFFSQGKEKKSDLINGYNLNYHSFVDDHVENIVDVIENTNSFGKEFLIPRYRYNLDLSQHRQLIQKQNAEVLWFDNGTVGHNTGRITESDNMHLYIDDSLKLNWH